MTKFTTILSKFSGGTPMKNNQNQMTNLTSEIKEENPLNIIVQDKLNATRKRYKELENKCQEYINDYDNLIRIIGTYNYMLTDKTLEFEQRSEIEEKIEPLIKRQKENEREYVRQKRLLSRINSIIRSIDNLKINQATAEQYKAQADWDLKEVVRRQQSAKEFEKKWQLELRKIDERLDKLWNDSESEEFVG